MACRRPEASALHELVPDNLHTLYGAIDNGALDVRLPKHAKRELEAFLECGVLWSAARSLLAGASSTYTTVSDFPGASVVAGG